MIYIMRHGKTDWNVWHKLQGRTDIPLNEEGRQMALAAGKSHAHIPIDVCYCSPLIRARETAELFLQDRDVPIHIDERLIEMGFGEFEGGDFSNQPAEHPMSLFFKQPERYVPGEGGETFEQLFARTGDFLQNVAYPLDAAGKNVLIVGHGAMNSSILCQRRGLDVTHFWDAGIENCKLFQL